MRTWLSIGRPGAPEPGAVANASIDATWTHMGRWSFGHPRCVLLEDGLVFLVYYSGAGGATTSARWALLEVDDIRRPTASPLRDLIPDPLL